MSQAYRVVFECPKSKHCINFQRKYMGADLTEMDALKLFGNEEISCGDPDCGWHGKASKAKLLRILRFNWILSPAT